MSLCLIVRYFTSDMMQNISVPKLSCDYTGVWCCKGRLDRLDTCTGCVIGTQGARQCCAAWLDLYNAQP